MQPSDLLAFSLGVALAGVGGWIALSRARMAWAEQRHKAESESQAKLNELTQQCAKDVHEADRRALQTIESMQTVLAQDRDALRTAQADLAARETALSEREQEIETALARISRLTAEEARAEQEARFQSEIEQLANQTFREREQALTEEAETKARTTLLHIMERHNPEFTVQATTAIVPLATEDMKGRLIGREGRNIRSFEQITGVDLIIDETPEAVILSCFDPVRRETARLALMNLMIDGRIHPGRIEEVYQQAQAEIEQVIRESGELAVVRSQIPPLPAKVVETMGRLRFRTSYAQNVLDHSVETALLAGLIASELKLNVALARRAGFLHDIGKALPPEYEGPHALAGMEFLKQCGMKGAVLNAVGAHHYDIEPASPEAQVVIVADSISASRPGARRESLDKYVKHLSELESLAMEFPGVERVFAMSAGREIRVFVKPAAVNDLQAAKLAKEIAQRIEAELEYGGQIKITVIRETRIQETAK